MTAQYFHWHNIRKNKNRRDNVTLPRIAPVVSVLVLAMSLTCDRENTVIAPDFIFTVRSYNGAGYDEFQRTSMNDLGLEHVQGLADFMWENIEAENDEWKWDGTDAGMDALSQAGLKVIPFIQCPKIVGLPWDSTITRDDPVFIAEYQEFAYEVASRYHDHPAWSGLVALMGASSDIWDHSEPLTDPEVVVPLMNAAYDGIKQADSSIIIIGFNFGSGISTEEWEEYHTRAFALSPKFDWYSAHCHDLPVTLIDPAGSYGGVYGLTNIRSFLDSYGYTDKAIWMNEGGFRCGEDLGGISEERQAEQIIESYIVPRALDIDFNGWVYFEYFSKTHEFEGGADFGLMTPLDEHDPPEPRTAWTALQVLIKTVQFFDYEFDAKLSGEFGESSPPFVYRFVHQSNPLSQLYIIFSPWLPPEDPIEQTVVLNIAPATYCVRIDMLGEQNTILANASGAVAVTSTSSPTYLKVVVRP